ncbi:NAD(P)-binding domain-containing protein, partial [Micromonospora zhanjiangensis]
MVPDPVRTVVLNPSPVRHTGVDTMRIGIIGTGNMAEALGGQWARAGHDVLVGGRNAGRATALAERIGARPGDPR